MLQETMIVHGRTVTHEKSIMTQMQFVPRLTVASPLMKKQMHWAFPNITPNRFKHHEETQRAPSPKTTLTNEYTVPQARPQ